MRRTVASMGQRPTGGTGSSGLFQYWNDLQESAVRCKEISLGVRITPCRAVRAAVVRIGN